MGCKQPSKQNYFGTVQPLFRRKPGSSIFGKGRSVSTLVLSSPDGQVMEMIGSLLAPRVAVTTGHGLDQSQGACADSSESSRARSERGGRSPQPCPRVGVPTSDKASPRPSLAQSMPTSTSEWHCWPVGNTDSKDFTGPTAINGTGWRTSGSNASPGRCAIRLRMRCDERCRKAVCRRTACTV